MKCRTSPVCLIKLHTMKTRWGVKVELHLS